MKGKKLTSFYSAIANILLSIDSNLCAIHVKRVTIQQKDIQLIITLTQSFRAVVRPNTIGVIKVRKIKKVLKVSTVVVPTIVVNEAVVNEAVGNEDEGNEAEGNEAEGNEAEVNEVE